MHSGNNEHVQRVSYLVITRDRNHPAQESGLLFTTHTSIKV